MATRTVAQTLAPSGHTNIMLFTWSGLANGDDGSPVDYPDFVDRCVAFTGIFGAGGTIQLEGSIDGTNYFPLTDPQGNNISKTAAAIEQVIEMPRWVRPRVTGGDGTTALVCNLWARRGR